MKIVQSRREIELQTPEMRGSALIERHTLFQYQEKENKVILVELDNKSKDFLEGGKHITLSEEQWQQYKEYFSFIS